MLKLGLEKKTKVVDVKKEGDLFILRDNKIKFFKANL